MGTLPNASSRNYSVIIVDHVVRSLFQYGRSFAFSLLHAPLRQIVFAHLRGATPQNEASTAHRELAMSRIADHFCAAQDHGEDDGLGSYHLIDGWSASYPETTGYIIP